MMAIRIYLVAARNNIMARMAYRGDFFISCTMSLIIEMLIPLITLLIYRNNASFPGWSVSEALLLQGVFMLSNGFGGMLFSGVLYQTLVSVREGTHDLIRIRPCSSLWLCIAQGFDPDRMGSVLGGMLVMGYALYGLPKVMLHEWMNFFVLFLFSVLMIFACYLLTAGSAFKWVGNSRLFEIFDSATAFGNYPRSIYTKGFQNLITYVFPVSAIAFFPASALLSRPTEGFLGMMTASIVWLAFSLWFWKRMYIQYTSAGG